MNNSNRFFCTLLLIISSMPLLAMNEKTLALSSAMQQRIPCTECNKTFTTISCLNRHVKSHTNPTPYKCDQCSNCFSAKTSLTRHINSVHNKTTEYSCDECDKKFNDKSNWQQHLKRHTITNIYICPSCDKLFTFKHSYIRHMQELHSITISSDAKIVPLQKKISETLVLPQSNTTNQLCMTNNYVSYGPIPPLFDNAHDNDNINMSLHSSYIT